MTLRIVLWKAKRVFLGPWVGFCIFDMARRKEKNADKTPVSRIRFFAFVCVFIRAGEIEDLLVGITGVQRIIFITRVRDISFEAVSR